MMDLSSLNINEWDLASTNLHRISKRKYEVAVIPTSATEAHNLHLPQGQDYYHATYVARKCCETAWPKCESVLCLPTLPFGVDCNQMAFPMAIHLSQHTLDTIMREIIVSLHSHGIKKIVILNGHGGNSFQAFIRQIQSDMDVHVFLCDWWKVGMDKYNEIFTKPDDHAGQMETSIAMALFPQLVEAEFAGSGKSKPFRFEALRKGWASTSRDFAKLNDHCGVGDPTGASPDKGEKYLKLACERISQFLIELANTPIDKNFPHSE